MIGFEEKPARRRADARRPEHVLASMGIYVFTARPMYELLCEDAAQPDSEHDFGRNIIPAMIDVAPRLRVPVPRPQPEGDAVLARRRHAGRVLSGQHGFDRGRSGAEPVRRRLADPHGSADAAAAQDRVLQDGAPGEARRGEAHDSIVCNGCIISGGHVSRSDPLAERAHQQLCRGRGIDPLRRRGRRPVRAHSPGDHRQRRARSRPHATSATTWSTTASAASR